MALKLLLENIRLRIAERRADDFHGETVISRAQEAWGGKARPKQKTVGQSWWRRFYAARLRARSVA